MKKIKLTQNKYVLVDDEDYAYLKNYKWYANLWNKKGGTKFYAERNTWKDKKRGHEIMHRIITKAPKGFVVDHINGNTLDNRKKNLRIVNRFENQQNRQKAQKNNKLGVIGVSYVERIKRYQVHLCKNGVRKYLGVYKTLKEAKETYNHARNI